MTAPNAPMSAEEVSALERLTHSIASELAMIDGFDPDDEHGGLYDLRWQGSSMPEPLGDAWSMDYLPKAERIARTAVAAMAEREAAQAKRIAELEEDFRRIEWLSLNPRGASTIIDGKARPCVFWGVSSAPENTLRQAIDAARAEDGR